MPQASVLLTASQPTPHQPGAVRHAGYGLGTQARKEFSAAAAAEHCGQPGSAVGGGVDAEDVDVADGQVTKGRPARPVSSSEATPKDRLVAVLAGIGQ